MKDTMVLGAGETPIPKYVQAILKNTKRYPAPYYYKVYGKHRYGQSQALVKDTERFIAWAKRCHADARILYTHRRDYRQRKRGLGHDYCLIELTDPVCHALEKAGWL